MHKRIYFYYINFDTVRQTQVMERLGVMKASEKGRELIGNLSVELLEREGIVLLHESELNFLKLAAKIYGDEQVVRKVGKLE